MKLKGLTSFIQSNSLFRWKRGMKDTEGNVFQWVDYETIAVLNNGEVRYVKEMGTVDLTDETTGALLIEVLPSDVVVGQLDGQWLLSRKQSNNTYKTAADKHLGVAIAKYWAQSADLFPVYNNVQRKTFLVGRTLT